MGKFDHLPGRFEIDADINDGFNALILGPLEDFEQIIIIRIKIEVGVGVN